MSGALALLLSLDVKLYNTLGYRQYTQYFSTL